MTKILFVAFSHALTEGQVSDAKKSLGVEKIITLSEAAPDIQEKFSQVPASATTQDIIDLASEVVSTAVKHEADYIYVAGEPSVVIHASIKALRAGLEVVQSTTERKSIEVHQPDGSVLKTAIFSHVQWRSVFSLPSEKIKSIKELIDKPIRKII